MVTNISNSGKPYARLIVDGSKTWEIRNRNTRIRGRIGIVFEDRILGTVVIKSVNGPLTPFKLAKYPYHMSTLKRLRRYCRCSHRNSLYAWVLTGAKKFDKPKRVKVSFFNAYDWVRIKRIK